MDKITEDTIISMKRMVSLYHQYLTYQTGLYPNCLDFERWVYEQPMLESEGDMIVDGKRYSQERVLELHREYSRYAYEWENGSSCGKERIPRIAKDPYSFSDWIWHRARNPDMNVLKPVY